MFLGLPDVVVRGILNPLAKRDVSFNDFQSGMYLSGTSIQGFQRTVTSSHCAWLCLTSPRCFSFNYCNSRNCELNSGDVFTSGAVLQPSLGCNYLAISASVPLNCEEIGVLKEHPSGFEENFCDLEEKIYHLGNSFFLFLNNDTLMFCINECLRVNIAV